MGKVPLEPSPFSGLKKLRLRSRAAAASAQLPGADRPGQMHAFGSASWFGPDLPKRGSRGFLWKRTVPQGRHPHGFVFKRVGAPVFRGGVFQTEPAGQRLAGKGAFLLVIFWKAFRRPFHNDHSPSGMEAEQDPPTGLSNRF